LIPVLEYLTGVSYMSISNCELDELAVRIVPESVARKYCLIPIFVNGAKLRIVMADPLEMIAMDDIGIITEYELEDCSSFCSDILVAINSNYGTSELAEQAMEEMNEDVLRAPEVWLFNSLLSQAVKMGARIYI